MKITLEIDAEDLGCASIALDKICHQEMKIGDEFIKAKEFFDKVYRNIWDLERCGVKELKI